MLVAAAVCPCPPLLVPEVAAGAAPELDPLRAACAEAVGVLAVSRPDLLVVVGSGTRGEVWEGGGTGSFREYGVDCTVRLGTGAGSAPLAPSLAVAAWLLERTSVAAPLHACAVPADAPAAKMLGLGGGLSDVADRVALLVTGDGSACRTLKAPGYLDERAGPYDATVAAALAAADTAALAGLDEKLSEALMASGRAPWQILAGAAEGVGLRGELLYDDAPYGVGYFVAAWA